MKRIAIINLIIDTDKHFKGHIPLGQCGHIWSGNKKELVVYGRGDDGLYLEREYYVPESHDDDDLSMGDSRLAPIMELSRRKEVLDLADYAS